MNNNNYRETLAEEAARRFQEDYIDGRNRCQRCHRPLNDPMADYGWRCAEILGLNQPKPLQEQIFSTSLGFHNTGAGKPVDKQKQNIYNWDGKTYISEQPATTKRPLTQVGNFDIKNLFLSTNPNIPYNKRIYDKADSLVDSYMDKVRATQLPEPIGKDENKNFVYAMGDPRRSLPPVMDAATLAEHIYKAALKKSWVSQDETDSKMPKNWHLLDIKKGMEGMKAGVYIYEDDNMQEPFNYIIAFKGTTPYNLSNWENNFEQAVSPFSIDMWDAIRFAREFKKAQATPRLPL